jgi:hypothetical protein
VGGQYEDGFQRKGMGGMDEIHLAQDSDKWTALENTEINPQVP